LFGRIADSGNQFSANTAAHFAERTALNSPLQGTARSDQAGVIRIDERLRRKFEAKMILQVHDELLFEAPTRNAPS